MARLESLQFSSLLDVGCGTGALLRRILREYPLTSARGIDLSPAMVGQAHALLGTRAHVLLGDAEQLPFSDDAFDVVTCVASFRHYPDPLQALAEMRRVLRPEGSLVFADFRPGQPLREATGGTLLMPYGDVHAYSERELVALAAEAGFQAIGWSAVGRHGQMLVAEA
jgi:ubiquinone/menaquinone biosynthesis C-methylase UbiE